MFNFEESKETDNVTVNVASIIICKKDKTYVALINSGNFPCSQLKNGQTTSQVAKANCENMLDCYTSSDFNYLNWLIVTDPILYEKNNFVVCYGVVLEDKVELNKPFYWKELHELTNAQKTLVTEIARKL